MTRKEIKKKNFFIDDAKKRHESQEETQADLGLVEKKSKRKVKLNITLPAEYKERLMDSAKEKHLSASVLIQMWIDEHC